MKKDAERPAPPSPNHGLLLDLLAVAAQCGSFLLGMAVSLAVGIVLAAHLDGPGGLILATLVAGAGLLGAAVGSQALKDYLIRREL